MDGADLCAAIVRIFSGEFVGAQPKLDFHRLKLDLPAHHCF